MPKRMKMRPQEKATTLRKRHAVLTQELEEDCEEDCAFTVYDSERSVLS